MQPSQTGLQLLSLLGRHWLPNTGVYTDAKAVFMCDNSKQEPVGRAWIVKTCGTEVLRKIYCYFPQKLNENV